MRGQAFLSTLLPLAVSALVAWQAGRLPLNGPVISPDVQPRGCTLPPTFKVASPADAAPMQTFSTGPQSYTFMSNGWMTADICQAGTLRVVGEGQVAVGAAPQLQVALNSRVIWTGAFTEKREVNIPIPMAGHLTLGYFNDFYSSNYRSASLERLRFTSAGCETFEVEVPSDAGGSWNPAARSVGWLFAAPITLKPCDAGTLHLRASGRQGGGKFATLEFKQGGKEIRKVHLSATAQALTLSLNRVPLEIRILDPYFKELGDRNLSLREIEFSPAR